MADEASGETKPEPKQENTVIEIIVKDQNGTEVHFKVKPHTKLEKVIKAYCDKKGIDQSTVRFVYDGVRVNPSNTSQDLGMETGDTIDCFIEQVGGGSRA